MSQKKRGANYTPEEKDFLLNIIKHYENTIEDKRNGAPFLIAKKKTWEIIATEYNRHASSGSRSTDQLKTLYDNLKQKARKGEDKELLKMGTGFSKMFNNLVEPLSNPTDSAAEYFKDRDLEPDYERNFEAEVLIREANINNECNSKADFQLDDMANMSAAKESGSNGTSSRGPPAKLSKYNPKGGMSSEALKRIYYRRKCENAILERKKLLQEVLFMKEEHELKMKLLNNNSLNNNTVNGSQLE